ncbi:MAG: M15 family metallopeptidase [Hamadaea sp.]|nr:M15 family metallopeptidase [Hamadaea sp.]
MEYSSSARTRARRRRSTILVAIAVLAAILGVAASRADVLPLGFAGDLGLSGELGSSADVDGGGVPAGVTVYDESVPAVANLDPDLLAALRQAATDATDDGVTMVVNSGWRSPEYQQQLLDEAVAKYGSAQEAARWVSTPENSLHVSGDAVDIGPTEAAAWLGENGAAYGLCQIYRNEPWHFELRPDAAESGCPRMYADPTRDPRMQ